MNLLFCSEFKLKEKFFDTSFFRKIFIIVLSLEMLAFVELCMTALKCLIVVWGVCIFVNNFCITPRVLQVKHRYILFMFLTSMVITSVVNFSVWFVPNIAIVYINASYFFMFYGMYTERSFKSIEKEMVYLLRFFIYFAMVCGVISLLFVFLKNDTCVLGYYLGIYKNRLIGIYTNSNILAFSMVECIVSCDILATYYMRNKYKSRFFSAPILIFAVAVSCVCLFLSDSNASFLFLIIYCTIRVFCNLFFKSESAGGLKFLKSVLITFSFCIVVLSVSFAVRSTCQRFISETITGVHNQEKVIQSGFENLKSEILEEHETTDAEYNEIKNMDIDEEIEKPKKEDPELTIGRHESYDVSSGRIMLLKQGLTIFKHHPIFGVGRANLMLYGKKYIEKGLINKDLHNGYLTILVCYGVVGLAIFGVISFVVAMDICKHIFYSINLPYNDVFLRLFSALVAYCGYCLFEKAILFDVTFMVGFFWLILGYAVAYTQNFKLEH